MNFKPSFLIGEEVTNERITREFKCANMGGMRRSHLTKTLLIVSDHTKGLYDDKWYGDTLHYTGMGKSGVQKLEFMQNRTLAESRTNDVVVHLFEVFISGKYIYRGVVELCGDPYQEKQEGEDGFKRMVWMFPLRVRSGDVSINVDILEENQKRKERKARKLTTDMLKKRAENRQTGSVSRRRTEATTYFRDPYVAEYAKRKANGICQLCGKEAPFNSKKGEPYLETHHIIWLSNGGADSIDNTVALCPNCHRKMHVLNLESDRKKLQEKASR